MPELGEGLKADGRVPKLFNIAFTGHRDVKEEHLQKISEGLNVIYVSAAHSYDNPVHVFHNGGASGFDTLAYSYLWPLTVEFALTYPHIPFTYQLDELLQYLDRHSVNGMTREFWSVDQSPCPKCGPHEYSPDKKYLFMKRNKHMVDLSDVVVSYWNGEEKGGTWNTIEYARKVGKPVLDIMNLNQTKWDSLVERFVSP